MRRRSAIRWSGRSVALLGALLFVGNPAPAFDRGADGTFDRRTSAHFVLYQDVDIDRTGGFRGSRQFEQEVLGALERAYEDLDRRLGLRPARKIDVVVYDPALFDQKFGGLFRFAAAGFYHGVVRVRGATRLNAGLTRVLSHELVHAAFDAAAPSHAFPGWFNEGIAEWFEARGLGKRRLSGVEYAVLADARRRGSLLPISALSAPNFAHLHPGTARLAYLQSYGLIDHLVRHHGERDLRQFCQEFVRSRNLRRTLKRVYRTDLGDLEARFHAELN